MVIPLWAMIAMGVSFALMTVFTFIQARKAQKKSKTAPTQLDGSIADEGVGFCDIAGSPHMYANIVDIFGQRTTEIKSKSGKK